VHGVHPAVLSWGARFPQFTGCLGVQILPFPRGPQLLTIAMSDHLFLPQKDELDKLLRYEAMINWQLNHAIAELESSQARRKGESTVI
jgi:hypothetical protein